MILLTGPNVLWSSTKFRGHWAQKGTKSKIPPFPVVCDRKNCFLTNRMHWNDLKVCMKKCSCFRCHFEVSILTRFGIFCHFRSLYTYTPCYGYNEFDWLTFILRLNWTCRIWFWILFLRPFCIVLSDFLYLLLLSNNCPLKHSKGIHEGCTLTLSHN